MALTSTTPENTKRITDLFEAQHDFICYVYARWQDEKEYEDIRDYQTAIQGKMPEGFVVTKMTKRPFGFEFTIGTDAVYAIQVTSRNYTWKRVK
jgi:hypothetical protein